MNKLIRACICTAILLITIKSKAQDDHPVRFSYDKERINEKEVILKIKVKTQPGVRLYALIFKITSFSFILSLS